ncbi:MAG: hypothetical protein K1X37_07165 [Saprospiraceae bacterium]|nr:hypothetical protein [Saprospiraceae bacterium]
MQFINPIEILQLSNVADSSQIDSDTIKKAKRRLFADIDLSDDGHYNYYGLQLSKGDCEKAIDELSNNDLKEFYLYLTSNKKLNEFLVNGNENVFVSFKQDSIFKLPDFVNFISPYYAPKFDKALSSAFEDEDVELLKSILKTSFLISQNNVNTAYKGVSNILQNRLSEISEIRTDIKNEESVYDDDDIHEVVDLVTDYFPTDPLNCLPNYFQSQILKIANEINYLNVAIWDNFDTTQVSQDLLEHILTLNIDGLNKPTFQKNYEIVKRKNQERIEEERNAPILRKYAGYLIQTKSKLEEIESKTLTPNSLLSWVNSSISIPDVNRLPRTFDEIKNQIALSLRAMSVSVWNSYSNIDVSIDLINKANNITGLKSETQENLLEAKKQLTELKTKIDIANLVRQRTVSTPTQTRTTTATRTTSSSSSNNNSGCLWLIGIAVVIGVIVAISNSNKSSSSYNNSSASESYTSPSTNYSNDNSYSSPTTTTTPVEEYAQPVESEYKGNQLKDGASPLDGCFGKGIYSGNASLTIDNGGSSDAIVCLYSVANGRTIRNEYVRKNSSFTMSNISQGSYKIRVFYGNDWNPTLTNSCGTKGNFESDVHFSEFDGTEYFEDSDRGYTTATITLYTVAGGNASSSSIDQSTFFNN